ncbi:MAG: PadR family transcriptional regulator [Anaerolineales bacterium]
MVEKENSSTDLTDNLLQELRRGALVMAVLSQLKEEQYGYSLKQRLGERGLEVNEGTLYPLMRRLENQGLLQSHWEVVDDARPRRYYQISPEGENILTTLITEWQSLTEVIEALVVSNH